MKSKTKRPLRALPERNGTVRAVGVVAVTVVISATAWASVQSGATAAAVPAQEHISAVLNANPQPVPLAGSSPAEAANPGSTPGVSPAGTTAAKAMSEKDRARIPRPVSRPAPLNASVTMATGVNVRLAKIEAVQGEASMPGEVAGPSIRFQVVIDNPTARAISITPVVVNMEAGAARTPALQLSGPGIITFPDSVAPHSSVSAVYVFNVPPADRSDIRILVDYGPGGSVALFEGSAAQAGAGK